MWLHAVKSDKFVAIESYSLSFFLQDTQMKNLFGRIFLNPTELDKRGADKLASSLRQLDPHNSSFQLRLSQGRGGEALAKERKERPKPG